MEREKFVLGISGASGIHLGIKFLQNLPNTFDIYVVLSTHAEEVFHKEIFPEIFSNEDLSSSSIHNEKILEYYLNLHSPDLMKTHTIKLLDPKDIGANIASGSFGIKKMAIIPTSMNTLAKIAHGIADCLLTRSASVMIKENRLLLLAPREMPLSSIALENMLKLSSRNIIISPPILGYYSGAKTLEEMENFLIGKWLDSLDIQHNLYRRWK